MSDGGDSRFAYGLMMFSVVALVLLSILIPFCCPKVPVQSEILEQIESEYTDFTGTKPVSESVWALNGIFTPYGVDADGNPFDGFGYTDDGWLYGARAVNYTPSQYLNKQTSYRVQYDEGDGIYRYTDDADVYNQHKAGDVYGAVVMDRGKKSSIFFTSSGKVTEGDFFYYSFDGYRYSFSPTNEYTTIDADGNNIDVVPNTTSLSLIWYDWYGEGGGPGGTGLAGQLIITGSDSGVGYLTGAMIVSAFNNDTSSSRFVMTFNGVDMIITIRLDATALASGMDVETCYNEGFWSVMVSSKSVDASSLLASDYDFNPYTVFETMIDLMTFRVSDYGLTGMAGTLASLVIVLPLFIGLLVVGLSHYKVLIIAGIYGVISAWNLVGGL